jgi:hypothetical protein
MAKNIKLKGRQRRSAIICILLAATVLIVSFSLASSATLLDQQTASITPIEQQEVMPVQTSQKPSPPRFNVDVAYAFVGKGPSEAPHSYFGWDVDYPESQYPSAVYLNVTHRVSSAAPMSCDALIEVFLIQIISDKGPTESYAYFEGTNYEPSFSDSALTSLTARIYDLIDPSTVNGVTGHFRFNWTDNTPIFGGQVGSFGSYSSNPMELGLWSAGKPNTISVTVRRIGCVTMDGGSISVRADVASANAELQVQKFGDGFLYNKVVPADKLAQTKLQTDLFQPFT